jgi:pyruvate dehydrogenase E2 component (dihydrolipoamide acetyltransferase)
MARLELPLPKLGLTMEEGVVLEFHVSVGESIAAGADLVTIETDKIDNVVESPCAGTVVELLVEVGETYDVGTPLCVIEEA